MGVMDALAEFETSQQRSRGDKESRRSRCVLAHNRAPSYEDRRQSVATFERVCRFGG
jgi:hypothetical protein